MWAWELRAPPDTEKSSSLRPLASEGDISVNETLLLSGVLPVPTPRDQNKPVFNQTFLGLDLNLKMREKQWKGGTLHKVLEARASI